MHGIDNNNNNNNNQNMNPNFYEKKIRDTVEPLFRGHPDKRPTTLERPLDNVNPNINVLISTPDEKPPFL